MRFIGKDSPEGVWVAGMGLLPLAPAQQKSNGERGEKIFSYSCASSFNSEAGVSHMEIAATFI